MKPVRLFVAFDRPVAVRSCALLEALANIYHADRLVDELSAARKP